MIISEKEQLESPCFLNPHWPRYTDYSCSPLIPWEASDPSRERYSLHLLYLLGGDGGGSERDQGQHAETSIRNGSPLDGVKKAVDGPLNYPHFF